MGRTNRSEGPEELAPRDAVSRYLDNRRPEISDGSYSSYYYRLKQFVEWCEIEGIYSVDQLNGWKLEEFRAKRAKDGLETNSLHNEMETLAKFIEYLERIEAVEEDLSERVDIPEVPKGERSRETMLEPEQATKLLRGYRNDESRYGNRFHVLLELAWHTGARLGALRGLDLRDFEPGDNYIRFVHRPETDTPLKNKRSGERMVSLLPEVREVISHYIGHERLDAHDKYGRQPLLATHRKTRPGTNTVRAWMYQATFPCHFGGCPHGYDPPYCEFKNHSGASKCPSSRAPHHVRTGSITWHRDRGIPPEVTANRVNASIEIIEEYYDKATQLEKMENRRRPHIEKLDLSDDQT